MAQERISSIVSQSAFDELDRLQNSLIATEKKIQGFEFKIGDAKSIQQTNGMLVELSVNTEAVTNNVAKQVEVRGRNTKAINEELAAQKNYEKQREKQERFQKKFEAAKARENKLIVESTSAYKLLSKAHAEAELRAKDYALELGAQHPITIQAIADANKMGDTLKGLDASVGRFTRNVGNYNNLQAQTNQLLREAPNFALGWRTAIMALSNNVTYFGEAVAQARRNGDSWRSVLGQLGKSFFSFVGILNIAITAITYFSLRAASSEKAVDKLADSMERYNDALVTAGRETGKSAIEEANKLRILTNVATDATASMDARVKATNQMQELYPNYLKNLTQEAIMSGKAAQAIEDITKALLVKAQAAAAEKRLMATEERILDLQEQQQTVNAQLQIAQAKKYKGKKDETGVTFALASAEEARAKKNLDNINKELAAAQGLRDEYLQTASDRAAAALSVLDFTTKDTEQQKQTIVDLMALYRELNVEITDGNAYAIEIATKEKMQSLFDLKTAEINSLDELELRRSAGLVNLQQYEQERERITKKSLIARAQAEIVYAEAVKKLTTDKEQVKEITQRISELRLEIAKLKNEIEDLDLGKTTPKKEDLNNLILLLEALRSITTEIIGIQSDQLAAKINNLQKEGQLIDENGRREIEKIKNSALSEADKQKAIREQEALTESQRIANEAKRRDAAIQKAKFDKAAAISEIILNTGIAVIKAWTEGDPYTKAIRAGAAAATGAAQLARAAAQPLPAYEGGTFDHIGGKFIAGEKERELVVTPSGRSYWTNDKPTVYNEPKGTMVFNKDMINTLLGAGLTPRLINAVNGGAVASDLSDKITEAIDRGSTNTIRAIRQNRAIQSVNLKSDDSYYISKIRGKA